jgi:hypothetical protein
MIGERIESQHSLPLMAYLFLAAGVGLVVAGLATGVHGMVTGAILPLALGGSLWLFGQERPLTAMFRDTGLEVETDGEPILVPYTSIQDLKAGGRPADPARFRKTACPIAVVHEGGVLRIPSRLNFPSHEVFQVLAERVPANGGRAINPVLAEYLERQERSFGPDKVWTFRAASHRVRGERRGYRAIFIGLMVAGGVWSVIGFSGFGSTELGLGGVVCGLIGAGCYASSFAENALANPVMKNWKNASLVISPQGMAMVQGAIQGEVKWPELLEIKFNAKPVGFNFGHYTAIPGIMLRVKGAKILIADIYDRPLHVIYNRILALSGRDLS